MSNKHVAAYRSVDEALRLDANENNETALMHYLNSISILVEALIQDADRGVFPNEKNQKTKKLLSVAKQCFDRVGEISHKLNNENYQLQNSTSSSINDDQMKQIDLTLYPDIKMPNEGGSTILDMSVSTFDTFPPSSITQTVRPITLSPLDQVQRENKQLLTAYKARLSRTQTMKGKADLNLALHRRLTENVMLAKAKERVLTHRNQEVQKRLLEHAARKIGNENTLGSKENENKKEVYTKILEYEFQMKWPRALKEKLIANPQDFTQIDLTIRQTLSVPGHPISTYVQKLQFSIYDKVIHLISRCPYSMNDFSNDTTNNQTLSEDTKEKIRNLFRTRSESIMAGTLPDFSQEFEVGQDLTAELESKTKTEKILDIAELEEDALQRHLHYIVTDVRCSLEKLLSILLLTYETLDSPEGRDQCYASMEEPFFKPLWPYLITLFRLAYKSEESKMNEVMSSHSHKTLNDLRVPRNFWVDEKIPFKEAISEMKSILNQCCPLKKLDTLVRVAHLVCQNNDRAEKPIGADDLIPILCYVVLQTNCPQLITECHAMEEFIHECYLMGEEGYCLTTMQTVFQYLNSLLPFTST